MWLCEASPQRDSHAANARPERALSHGDQPENWRATIQELAGFIPRTGQATVFFYFGGDASGVVAGTMQASTFY